MWEIDKDYIEADRVGTTGETIDIGVPVIAPEIIDLPEGPKVRFIMSDDDGEVYFGGWLHNDAECLNQQAALAFGMRDAGCTTIEVKLGGKWTQEIG